MFKTEIGEFKGSKTISIMDGDRRVISFGVNKARAIIACFDQIRQFAESTESNTIKLDGLSEDQKKIIEQFLKS